MGKLIDLTGKRFGDWTVIERCESTTPKITFWRCLCNVCGNIFSVNGNSLRYGDSSKCSKCSHIQNGKNAKGKTKIGVRKNDTTVLVNKLFSQYKQSAHRRNLVFRLTKEQIRDIIFINCDYCGISPNNLYTLSGRVVVNTSVLYNGIDRVDNSKGYEIENVVPCCGRCNRAKDVMSKEEFLDWIKAVYKKRIGENK